MIKENKDIIKMSIIFKLIYRFSTIQKKDNQCVCGHTHVLNLIILKITWNIKEVSIAKMG